MKEIIYDGEMDEECIELCDTLNELPGVKTTESCCGHFKDKYRIFINCTNFYSLAVIGRSIDKRYSRGNWTLKVDVGDIKPMYGFLLESNKIFDNEEKMTEALKDIIENIKYWSSPKFFNYFENHGR